MSVTRADSEAAGRPARIDKPLFEAGSQCAKRLHLEANGHRPPLNDSQSSRQALTEIGEKVIELARGAFPGGLVIAGDTLEERAEATREAIDARSAPILFDACFLADNATASSDVVIVGPDGKLDIFEVKAGTTVKHRHVFDVALQIHTIEACGLEVGHATVLHLDPRYEHAGGDGGFPVQKLFRHDDVTARARKLSAKLGTRIERFLKTIDDPGALDLPTGTHCHTPLPCPFFTACLDEGPVQPLTFLPGLTRAQETQFFERAIEDLEQIPVDEPGLTMVQRRALRALRESRRVTEPLVFEELEGAARPIAFVHVQWLMEVLPRCKDQHPWQKMPFQWSVARADDTIDVESAEFTSFAAVDGGDPRTEAIEGLAKALHGAGTIVTYQPEFERRMRVLLDHTSSLKSPLRTILGVPWLDLASLIERGTYDPAFEGSFDQDRVYEALTGLELGRGLSLKNEALVDEAIRRTIHSRIRSKTRDRIAEELNDRGEHMASALISMFCALSADD